MDRPQPLWAGTSGSTLATDSISFVSKELNQSSDSASNATQAHQVIRDDDSPAARRSFSLEGPNAVTWEGDSDPNHPRNFRGHIKCAIALTIGMMNLVVSLAVSLFTGFLPQLGQEYEYGAERMQLCLTVYILGLAFGPIFFGPASEYYGRKKPLLLGMLGFIVFTTYTTFARDFGGVLFCRFLAGACGSAAYVIPPGIFVDLYGPVGRAIGYQLFATGAFIGGSLGPGIGFSVTAQGGWRWNMWLLIAVAAPLTATLGVLPETLEVVLLQRKSKRLCKETGDWTLRCARDERPVRLHAYLLKPWQMLIREPVLMVVTVAFTLDYGIQSLTYSEIPYAFRLRAWSTVDSSWALVMTIPGFLLGCLATALDTKLRLAKQLSQGSLVAPEERLPPMIVGMALLSLALVWFGQTSAQPHLPWAHLASAETTMGVGMFMVWCTATVYVQDLYVSHSNSALAACAFVRYSSGAIFPLLAEPLRAVIGVSWAISSLGLMCAVLVPFHFVFYFCGKRIRSWSRYALHGSFRVGQRGL
ncbi:hypothetical protein AC579_5741 [Pseudocercospora musae]|uniref:Major facilitator superfamily (MFS) profile domain-containing protein n=1 Tax=Pseudocercospora musae TaxID=113226 RepID=A0A139IRH9_9PEZI|nr:hypothetical protein AC579_5741 [Pseudocercospora musae]